MKLTYINTDCNSESESDYETAVDLVHYTFSKTEHIFKSKTLNISFIMEENSSSTSYLEEDYDEDSGKTNGWNKVNNDDSRTSYNYYIQLEMPEKVDLLSQEKALDSLIYKNEYIDYNYLVSTERYNLSEKDFNLIDDYIVKNTLAKNKEYEIITSLELNKLLDSLNNDFIELLKNNVINAQENLFMIEKAKKMIKDDAENEKGIINHQLQNIFLYEKDSKITADKIIELIKKGADFSIKNDLGDNFLMIAARKNMNIVCQEVLHHIGGYREDYLENNVKFSFDEQNEDGENLLMIFTKRGNKELVSTFLNYSNSTNPIYQTNKFGKDVYSFAKDYGRKEIIEELDNYKEKLKQRMEMKP